MSSGVGVSAFRAPISFAKAANDGVGTPTSLAAMELVQSSKEVEELQRINEIIAGQC